MLKTRHKYNIHMKDYGDIAPALLTPGEVVINLPLAKKMYPYLERNKPLPMAYQKMLKRLFEK